MNKNDIIKILKKIFSKEKKNIHHIIIKDIKIYKNKLFLYLVLDNPTLHIKNKIKNEIEKNIYKKFYKKIYLKINIETYKKNKMFYIKNIIAVSSGKGGVGKSTLSSNIAVSLSNIGFKTGLLDADMHGPSIPIMFNIKNPKIKYKNINGNKKMIPIKKYNIKIFSIGFFTNFNEAIVWRGPMIVKALHQLIYETYWGNLDFLIVDLPPGTGDIHLSLVQDFSITGIVVVSTPQKVALSDTIRSIKMFQIPSIHVPIIGLIENMSYISFSKLSNDKYFFLGKNGVKELSNKLTIPFLGKIPFLEEIRISSDIGTPIGVNKNSLGRKIYKNITNNIIKIINNKTNLYK
jgi:ATP-binding protein involved in chromosome partitioning